LINGVAGIRRGWSASLSINTNFPTATAHFSLLQGPVNQETLIDFTTSLLDSSL
jgi:hypothetical protein